jgi:prepilin-type N-terminal cleavage/methylation domain-containing protein
MMKYRTKMQQNGFTLVELSVVLVVIGIIIGAVAIGKDLQRNATYQQINSAFVQPWAQAYQTYYERNGIVVGDNATAPTLKVNANTTERCSADLFSDMDAAGITMPQGRAEGSEDAYAYLDSNGIPQQVTVCFQNVTWSIPGASSGYVTRAKNVMVIKSLTPDLARFIDNQVDGRADARFGLFREDSQQDSTSADSVEWSINNSGLDELQIAVVNAYYLMNQ